jgi:hypothetical protein
MGVNTFWARESFTGAGFRGQLPYRFGTRRIGVAIFAGIAQQGSAASPNTSESGRICPPSRERFDEHSAKVADGAGRRTTGESWTGWWPDGRTRENWENYWRFRANLNKLKISDYLLGF